MNIRQWPWFKCPEGEPDRTGRRSRGWLATFAALGLVLAGFQSALSLGAQIILWAGQFRALLGFLPLVGWRPLIGIAGALVIPADLLLVGYQQHYNVIRLALDNGLATVGVAIVLCTLVVGAEIDRRQLQAKFG